MLDVVCCGNDLNSSSVHIIDVGLCDHCLLRWTSSVKRPAPVYTKSTRRLWRSFDLDVFQSDLRLSPLCDTQRWRGLDGDDLVKLYDDIIAVLLDRQVPVRTVTCRRRPSDGWFDDECRHAK